MRKSFSSAPEEETTTVVEAPTPAPDPEAQARAAYFQKIRDDLARRRGTIAAQIAELQREDAELAKAEGELG